MRKCRRVRGAGELPGLGRGEGATSRLLGGASRGLAAGSRHVKGRRVCGRRGLATGAGGVSGKTQVLGAISDVFAAHDGCDASPAGRGGDVSS